ncbi:hypothetical protein PEPNEM18_00119 [Aedoeadaptatus nemausensis]|uniref:SLH domain-containing protein n=1 Tax=Aedoeadaptatus nemausensis TaxID=2582829 RepID=A0A6V6XYR0_9FIRM|nr:S-layer homology domain-containing protein [Peptoniphilus nemausensis]CAC9922799.1 hypothetical protein PEPNEM18_00119 [Peptoniphilus nemausensis]
MTKRTTAFLLALLMVAQVFVPSAARAEKASLPNPKMDKSLVQVGKVSGKDYPKLTNKVILDIQKQATENSRKNLQKKSGATRFNTPYLPGQNIPDKDKPKIVGKVSADFKTKGLDGEAFDWEGVFGKDSNGNPGKAKLVFQQWLNNKETDVSYELEVSEDGTYSWKDWEGQPARIPLYSKSLEPYTYSVYLDQNVSEKVKLLTYRIAGTPGSGGFEKDPETGLHVADIVIDLSIQQVASTKFISEWHTGLAEDARPPVNGEFDNKIDEYPGYFPFSTKDGGSIIIRNDFINNSDYVDPGYSEYSSSDLVKTPVVKVTEGIEFVDENDEEGTPTYKFDEANKTIMTLDGAHKFKYDFTYDVINGGKLTMTEILPVTFDANGGKFDSITDATADQKIVKEVEYSKDLTNDVEVPKKDLETFKGWATAKDGKPLSEEDFKAAIKNIKEAKTFYAIWDNNEIQAEELTVNESFKADGATEYTNDFIPTLDTLKGQVKIKDASGTPQKLAQGDTFSIVDGEKEYATDAELKDYLYGKLQEKDNSKGEPTRVETVKAKVTHANGTSQTVEIPIKVIKNIYEAKTLTEKPFYVPENYVQVTLDPTTKASDPQKTYYYVNKEAHVVIPGEDPTGAGDNKFLKWTIPGTPDPQEYKLSERHQFKDAITITAQYVSDVIPQEGDTKPEGVPDNFVEVTFVPTDNGTMEGAKIFWVNPEKEVTIPVKNPVGKQYFTFEEWKIGDVATGETYTVGTPKQFTDKNGTTITATYGEAKNIIPYDPKEPITRPVGYVRVTFEAEKGLKLTENKAYYVKQDAKDAQGQPLTLKAIKDDTTNYGYPTYSEDTGYKFDKWDKEDSLVIETADIVVTAKGTKLDNVIPEKDKNGKTNEKPEGYKEVTFVVKTEDASKGSIEGVTKFYVNPKEYVTINPPSIKANTGYEFGAWDKDATRPTVYEEDITITASFNDPNDVIPKTKKDESEKPAGYVTVTFLIDPAKGGSILHTETKVFFVKPNTAVALTPPKTKAETGYEFDKWQVGDKPFSKGKVSYDEDTTVKGSFKTLESVIDGNKPKPAGYVTVIYDKGKNGRLAGQTTYHVNPYAGKTVGDLAPEVKADLGYKFTEWSFKDTYVFTNISDGYFIYAKYDELGDVIPKTKEDESEKPDGYITVKFSTEDNGKIADTDKTEKVVYVNPEKGVVLKGHDPKVTPNTGFDFADWDTQIEKAIQYKDNDVIKAKYNAKGDVIPQEKTDGSDMPAGYLTVTFDKGEHGELSGKTVYYVKPNTKVTVPAPTVTPVMGWKQKTGSDAWDKALTQTFAENTTITAQYEPLKDMIPQEKTDGSDKPSGYKVVKFVGNHGSLSGTTVYYVNPNKEVDFTETVKAFTKTPDFAYTEVGGTWSPAEFKQKFTADETTFTFSFKKLGNVIQKTKDDESEKPKGYVKVTLIPTDKATDQTIKVFFVNPKEEVTIPSTDPVGKEITDANKNTYTFTFANWSSTRGVVGTWKPGETIKSTFTQDTDITAEYGTKVKIEKLVPAPVPKKDMITPKGVVPDAGDLIKNVPGSETDPLPEGTNITYVTEPKVDKDGSVTAKVKIEYPGGKTVVVEVPITVVKNVVPQMGTDKPTVPDNYVMVKFVIDPATGGKIADKETTIYYVNPDEAVTIPQPKTIADTGYSFKGWDKDTKTPVKYAIETQIKGSFTQGKDIIPQEENGKTNTKPDGYVTVTFEKGANGSLEGQTVYFVNPKVEKILNDVPHPTIKPATGFIANGWDTNDTTEIKTDITVTAQYQSKDDVVPQMNDDGSENTKPDGYITVTFDTTDIGGNEKKTVFVNPNKPVVLKGYEPQEFNIRKGFSFARWDSSIDRPTVYRDGTVIKALYNEPWNISTTEVQGYAKVEFEPGDHGSLSGTTDYWVKPDTVVNLPAPAVEPNTGYRFAGWDKSLVVTLRADDPTYVITATYSKIEKPVEPPVVPDKPREPERIVETRVETRVVEVPVRDRNYRKEVWYMCGFEGDFRPYEGLKRSEAAQILANALKEDGYKYDPNYPIDYKDVGKNWYNEAVRITTQANVFVGYPDGYFRPDEKISTVEWIATLRRFQQIAEEDGNHMNLRAGHWATAEIEAAYKAGWLDIYPQGLAKFKADAPMPREEVAAVSNRAFNRVMDRDYIRRNDKNLMHYRDVKPSMWSYDDILLASNTFMHDGRFFKAHTITQDNVIFNVNIDGLTITQDLFQRIKR